jgi:hypothetical protein
MNFTIKTRFIRVMSDIAHTKYSIIFEMSR